MNKSRHGLMDVWHSLVLLVSSGVPLGQRGFVVQIQNLSGQNPDPPVNLFHSPEGGVLHVTAISTYK